MSIFAPGYCPLSVRIVEEFIKPEGEALRTMGDVLNLLPGPQFDIKQQLPAGLKPKGETG